MDDKRKKIIADILYWIITIVLLSSMGVWLPFVIDYHDTGATSLITSHEYPGNLLTYALGIFIIAVIDRKYIYSKEAISIRIIL